MKKLIILFVLVIGVNFTACKSEKKEVKKEMVESNLYQCPMKCEKEKTYKEKGKCPVCKMNLVKKSLLEENKEEEKEDGHTSHGH